MSKSEADRYPLLLDGFRYFCAFMLYTYGVSKLLHLQFDLQSQLAQQPIGSLTGYQLTWFYFGYSRSYAVLLGMTQILGGTLLLFRKTTLLGALLMLPVMANILLINIFILVNDYGPFLVSGILCLFLTTILWHQRTAMKSLFWDTQENEPTHSRRRHRWMAFGLAFAATMMMISGALVQQYVKHSRAQAGHLSAVKSHNR